MKIVLTVLLTVFSVFAYAGKPLPEPSEPGFVGYSSSGIPQGTYTSKLWVIAATLCKESFGESAFTANSKHMLAAINNGTYFSPDSFAVYTLANSDIGVGQNEFGLVNSSDQFMTTGSQTDLTYAWLVACAL